ncbi:hypothetical protein CLV71_13530 [Actinophytocola oryzae]|uniref:Uncharacterized protein n=1 Tax=Actinophytocola oryzae TaxID=502181 RepID=A0A4R7UPV4_9PSEU|nr:hypothetical protein CLV71_13530 [Actinophytocola oryzae]
MRNLTLIKCALGRHMSYATGMPTFVWGHRPVIVERKRFVTELPAARIQNQTTDLSIYASAPPHERGA